MDYRLEIPGTRQANIAAFKRGELPNQPCWRSYPREPLIKSHAVATVAFRDGMREARRSQWSPPLASRATKQTARKGAPDSVSRSVAREGAQSCRKKHRETGRSCCRSRTPSFAGRVAAAVPLGCSKMRRLRRCAPRLRSPGYDLRRAPRIHPHFASNAIRGGLNQRSLSNTRPGPLRSRPC